MRKKLNKKITFVFVQEFLQKENEKKNLKVKFVWDEWIFEHSGPEKLVQTFEIFSGVIEGFN